jgi:membrane protease YdiL (CAAX protease family)
VQVHRHPPLPVYFALTFLVAWLLWYAATALGGDSANQFLFLPGAFAPGIVAVVLTARAEGAPGVRALLAPLFKWEVGARWYLFALLFMAAIKLTVALVFRVATGDWPRFGDTPLILMLAATLVSTLALGQSGEEVGWRGYALPRMATRLGLGPASLILGVIWALWHLPLFFVPGTSTTGQSFPLYLLQVTALSVALAWLWWRTGGSLLLTMLLHAAVNNTKDIVPSAVEGADATFGLSASVVGWLTVLLLWICAGYFLAQLRGAKLKL